MKLLPHQREFVDLPYQLKMIKGPIACGKTVALAYAFAKAFNDLRADLPDDPISTVIVGRTHEHAIRVKKKIEETIPDYEMALSSIKTLASPSPKYILEHQIVLIRTMFVWERMEALRMRKLRDAEYTLIASEESDPLRDAQVVDCYPPFERVRTIPVPRIYRGRGMLRRGGVPAWRGFPLRCA